MTKQDVFRVELSYINNNKYKENAEILLNFVPDYFFDVPAASTGKYHPKFAATPGGLVKHTKVAVCIANDVLSLEYMNNFFSDDEKDLLLLSILFHDTFKLGINKEKYTRFDHPLLAAQFIKDNASKTSFNEEEINFMSEAISTHMGQWNTSDYSDVVLPVPSNKFQFFVHMCDYLSSRKYLDVIFDEKGDIVK